MLLKGATHPVTVYEICDADPPALLAHKMRTKDEFELGRLAYARGDFSEAERLFRDIAAADKQDHAAVYYRDRATVLASAVENLELGRRRAHGVKIDEKPSNIEGFLRFHMAPGVGLEPTTR